MNPRKIIVIGSSNTDMTVMTDRQPMPGETVLGGCFKMGAGGKGANQAVAAKRLGGDVSFVCKLGNDLFGDNAVEHYLKEGLDISDVMRCETPSGVALITVDKNAENSIVVASGANAEVTVGDIDAIADKIRASGILLLQLEIPVPAVVRAAQIASEAGVYVILNPAPAAELPDGIYDYLSLIVPNQTEMELITGHSTDSPEGIKAGFETLFSKGVRNVILTKGSKGAMLAENGDWGARTDIPARKVQAVDTTAAGDTFCGAVCVALSEGKTLPEAVEFATHASSLTVQKLGAQESIPYKTDINQF